MPGFEQVHLARQDEVHTYFVDPQGAIVHRHAGILDEDQLHDLIDEHPVG